MRKHKHANHARLPPERKEYPVFRPQDTGFIAFPLTAGAPEPPAPLRLRENLSWEKEAGTGNPAFRELHLPVFRAERFLFSTRPDSRIVFNSSRLFTGTTEKRNSLNSFSSKEPLETPKKRPPVFPFSKSWIPMLE